MIALVEASIYNGVLAKTAILFLVARMLFLMLSWLSLSKPAKIENKVH